jgi:hypothetical protein
MKMINLFRKRTGAKLSLVLLSIFLFLLLFAPSASAAMMGDIDDSGSINVLDVVLAKQHVLGLQLLTPAQKLVADVNGSGDVDVLDVDLIMRKTLGLITEFPIVQLQVSSVTAVNARQVEVVFNKAVTKSLAENPANYEVYMQGAMATNVFGTALNGAVAALQADGRTVVLTLNEIPTKQVLVSGTNFNRLVVKMAVGLAADYTNSSVAFVDTTAPTFQSVRSIGPNLLELTFSEPVRVRVPLIQLVDVHLTGPGNVNIPLDLSIPPVAFIDAKRQVIIQTTGVDLVHGATYTLGILANRNLVDYSGAMPISSLLVVPASRQFTHTAVTTAPTVSAAVVDLHTVRLTFNRPVVLTGPTLTNIRFRLNNNTIGAIQRNADDMNGSGLDFENAMHGTDGTQYDVTFDDPFTAGTNTLWIHYVVDSDTEGRIADNWGNILPRDTAVNFTVPVTVSPNMISARVVGPDTVKIIYSRTVVKNGFEPEQFVLKVNGGISGDQIISVVGNEITIRFPSAMLIPGFNYPAGTIDYVQSLTPINRVRDQVTGGYAVSPDQIVGILASE